MRNPTLILVSAITLTLAASRAAAGRSPKALHYYAADGSVALPDYGKWVFLGTGLGMQYTEQAKPNPPFTTVFAEPWAYDEFMKHGVWPNKTILVAEMRKSVTNLSINKTGYAEVGDPVGVEVEIKDSAKGGWMFYDVATETNTAKPLPQRMACYSCHAEHAAVDNTFVQFYPTLIETAKRKATYQDR